MAVSMIGETNKVLCKIRCNLTSVFTFAQRDTKVLFFIAACLSPTGQRLCFHHCLSLCRVVVRSVGQSVRPSVRPSLWLAGRLHVYVRLSFCHSLCMYVCSLSVCLSVLSVCLFVCLSEMGTPSVIKFILVRNDTKNNWFNSGCVG